MTISLSFTISAATEMVFSFLSATHSFFHFSFFYFGLLLFYLVYTILFPLQLRVVVIKFNKSRIEEF